MTARLVHADCVEAMRAMEPESIDAIVTDPPYLLGFMAKHWDQPSDDFHHAWAREAFRVLKPGGHLAAFGGTRTYHRLACAIEDAGFEIRDSLMWIYGQGFPKSKDVSKAIDVEAGAEREPTGIEPRRPNPRAMMPGGAGLRTCDANTRYDAPATPEAARWSGWGTALKPAHEPIVLARKPLVGTVAENVLRYGTGGLNVEGCRVEGMGAEAGRLRHGGGAPSEKIRQLDPEKRNELPAGRWPPNVLLTHDCGSECAPGCPVSELDRQSGESVSMGGGGFREAGSDTRNGIFGIYGARALPSNVGKGDSGGASRFFPVFRWDPDLDVPFRYVAKPARGERDAGLHDLEPGIINTETPPGTKGAQSPRAGAGRTGGRHGVGVRNVHPT